MSVGEHMRRNPVKVDPESSVREAAKQMEVQKAGCVVAVSGDGRPLGVVTDRDIAVRVLRRGLDPDETPVSAVMNAEITTVSEMTSLTNAMRRMRSNGVRRLPVTGSDGTLIGIFDWNDGVRIISGQLHQAARVAGAQA